MNKINCDEYNCAHNCAKACRKDTVKISEIAKCDSFDKKEQNDFERERNFLEEYAEMNCDIINTKNMILCDSYSCTSNKSGLCAKNKIMVSKDGTKPRCIDYMNKGE